MKYALFCGAASGLAQAAIAELDSRDQYTFFCCDIAYSGYTKQGNKHFLHLDVTNSQDFDKAKEYVCSVTQKLDLVANFAGIVVLGSLVELSKDTLDKIVAINLLGTYKCNATFFDMLARGSRIINISSEYGKICGVPFHTYYGITKHAIEIYNDGLRRELLGQGIKVIAIRPGAFATNMQKGIKNQFEKVVENTQLYKEPLTKMSGIMDGELKKAKDPKIFAKVFAKAATAKHPKRYYHANNSFKMKLLTLLPTGMQDWAFAKFLK